MQAIVQLITYHKMKFKLPDYAVLPEFIYFP